jgi:preprotein translocase subunit SecY
MKALLKKIKLIFTERDIFEKVTTVFCLMVLYRFFAAIPLPGVNRLILDQLVSNNQFFGFLDVFSGGGISTLSLVMMGVGPYITGSIIMQLLTVMYKPLKDMYHEEGESGRKKFNKISRFVTLPIATLQAFGLLTLLQKQQVLVTSGSFAFVTQMILIIAGCYIALWIGERISEFGIGSGVSLIIFAGIASKLPSTLEKFISGFTMVQLPMYIAYALIALLLIGLVVYITEAERKVPVVYTRQTRAGSSYGDISSHIPFRLNQAGVMPIIFAVSLLLFPQLLGNFLSTAAAHPNWQHIGTAILDFLKNPWWYGAIYFLLVVVFTYFYTAITIEPHTMADNLQKNGAFIPGVRPGENTEAYIGAMVSRVTLVGALFLGFIAVIPTIIQGITGVTSVGIGGTTILITVSVVIDLIKKTDALVSTREYE